MATAELKEIRRQMFAEMEEKLFENSKPEVAFTTTLPKTV